MINELFLMSALSVSPTVAFANGPLSHDGAPIRLITHTAAFTRRVLKNERRVLVIGGDPNAVLEFRSQGFQAFGALTDDRPATPYHAVTDAGKLGFLPGVFQTVFYCIPNIFPFDPYFMELKDAVRTIEPGGYFLFDERDYEFWPTYLKNWNFCRLPFLMGKFVIYQKGQGTDYLPRRKVNYETSKRFVAQSA